jgi:Holliday junction DNA helicase RuvA
MIDRIKGKMLEKSAGRLIVEVSGLGLMVQTPLSTFVSLPEAPSEISLFTRFIIREESWELFGFLTILERESFDALTSITRIGPRLALTIISAIEPSELAQAVINQDLSRLSGIKGIGTKTAERLLVELKDKAPKLAALSGGLKGTTALTVSSTNSTLEEAILALINLGYTRGEAEKAIRASKATVGSEAPLSDLLKAALKNLCS